MRKLIAFAMLVALAGCSRHAARPSNADFSPAIRAYLAERGDLCVGKSEWPIDVSEREAELGTRDARQMPVLERLGLVSSWDAIVERKDEEQAYQVRVKRYQLTQAGQKYYQQRTVKNARAELVPSGDFCAAHLSLDKIVRFELSRAADGRETALVSFTYHVVPAAWTADPEARAVFPAVARVIEGAEHDELNERVTRSAEGWVADDLLGAPAQAPIAPGELSAR